MPFGYPPRGLLRGTFQRLLGAPNFLRRLQWPTIERLLALEPEHVVLDVGAGDLQLTAELAKQRVRAVIAADAAPRIETLGYVARRLTRLRLVRADGMRLPLADGSVDRVLGSSVLQMVPDPMALLAECRRVLKVGGVLVLTVPEAYRYLPTDGEFLQKLNRMFGVKGKGYVAENELQKMLLTARFRPRERTRVPGPLGSFIWEASVGASHRFGSARVPSLLAFTLYPLARLDARQGGCELLMAAVAS
jgi:SAM-dependent methyltransferase